MIGHVRHWIAVARLPEGARRIYREERRREDARRVAALKRARDDIDNLASTYRAQLEEKP